MVPVQGPETGEEFQTLGRVKGKNSAPLKNFVLSS